MEDETAMEAPALCHCGRPARHTGRHIAPRQVGPRGGTSYASARRGREIAAIRNLTVTSLSLVTVSFSAPTMDEVSAEMRQWLAQFSAPAAEVAQ